MMIRSLALFALIVPGFGCAGRDAPPINYSVRAAPALDRGASLDAAETALIGMGYTIARRDTASGLIVTNPVAIDRAGERTVRADNPLRKIAEVRVAGTETDPKVHCKVVIQEQATESYRQLAFERGGDDLPGHQTAIDRDAATSAVQNSVWRLVRRDKAAEREILDRIEGGAAAP